MDQNEQDIINDLDAKAKELNALLEQAAEQGVEVDIDTESFRVTGKPTSFLRVSLKYRKVQRLKPSGETKREQGRRE